MFTNPVLERVYEIGIIPVIAFNSVDEALPLCKALSDGGLPAAEVTFRTACAEECIRLIHKEMPEMLLGAGTVLTKDQVDRAIDAGASFIVAPGFDPNVTQYVIDKGCLAMPGTATAGEMQQAMNMGCEARTSAAPSRPPSGCAPAASTPRTSTTTWAMTRSLPWAAPGCARAT